MRFSNKEVEESLKLVDYYIEKLRDDVQIFRYINRGQIREMLIEESSKISDREKKIRQVKFFKVLREYKAGRVISINELGEDTVEDIVYSNIPLRDKTKILNVTRLKAIQMKIKLHLGSKKFVLELSKDCMKKAFENLSKEEITNC